MTYCTVCTGLKCTVLYTVLYNERLLPKMATSVMQIRWRVYARREGPAGVEVWSTLLYSAVRRFSLRTPTHSFVRHRTLGPFHILVLRGEYCKFTVLYCTASQVRTLHISIWRSRVPKQLSVQHLCTRPPQRQSRLVSLDCCSAALCPRRDATRRELTVASRRLSSRTSPASAGLICAKPLMGAIGARVRKGNGMPSAPSQQHWRGGDKSQNEAFTSYSRR